ncbi:unnamed protein product [Phytomonas sp. Hart1]|nr:unnamed protein product [Phytomonas sp. Hart1]|eukprot:CCW67006.1 unnamed protein product [Phytomonas sp. isolate Hart1]
MTEIVFSSKPILSKIFPKLSYSIRLFHTPLQLTASGRCYHVLSEFTHGGLLTLGLKTTLSTTRRFHTNNGDITSITQHPEYISHLNELNECFEEARELIKDSFDSAGTVYFTEDLNDAKEQTTKTLQKLKELEQWIEKHGGITALEKFRRETSLKMSQLEEELDVATCKGQS